MDLTLTGDIANQIITLTKKDSKLALALARQFLSSVEPLAMARYLLTREVAASLLAARISKNPELTLRQLHSLAGRLSLRRAARPAAPLAATQATSPDRRRDPADQVRRARLPRPPPLVEPKADRRGGDVSIAGRL